MINKKHVLVFVMAALLVFGVLIAGAGTRQGWFSSQDEFTVAFDSGDGVFVGTPVSISGLKAGRVFRVDLDESNRVVVHMQVQSKYAEAIREDSKISLARPFIIGEREVMITAGTRSKPKAKADTILKGEVAMEITDILSGGKLSPYFNTFEKLMTQLQAVVEGDGTQEGVNLVKLYAQAYAALKSVESMSKDIHIVQKDFVMAPDTKKIMKDMAAGSGNIGPLMNSIAVLLPTIEKMLPTMNSLAGNVDKMTPEIAKTLQETAFTLRALQKSFILSGAVKDLKEEDAEKAEQDNRAPASTK